METMEINGEDWVKKSDVKNTIVEYGDRFIFRCRNAGVHIASYDPSNINGQLVTITNANRIFRWKGALTCSEIANKGIDLDGSIIASLIPSMTLIMSDICEIIPVAEGVIIEGNQGE